MMCVLVQVAYAGGREDLKKHFSDTAGKVKATSEPAQKRDILSKSLQTMSNDLDKVQSSPLVSKENRASMDRCKADICQIQDELAGINGYECVPDAQLNAYSDYVVQDVERADK